MVERGLEEWFADISVDKPLVVQVDNVDSADDDSLGMLAGLARIAPDRPLLARRHRSAPATSRARPSVWWRCAGSAMRVELAGLGAIEMLELCRFLFDDAPGVERFAEWLRERTAGSPLHALEISRQLLARGIIGYAGAIWTLPDQVPDAALPAALGDALAIRVAALGEAARTLAECLALQRQQPTFELCCLLSTPSEGRAC